MPRALVVGSPIEHSLSPTLHTAGYQARGLADWRYDRAEVQADDMPNFVTALDPEVWGISVTMPGKEAALALADQASGLAQEVGSANTLVRRDSGWFADNTDVAGVLHALIEAGCESAESAVIVGSGATARSVIAAIAQLGVRRVTFVVRSQIRPETRALAEAYDIDVHEVREDPGDSEGLIDLLTTTPLLVSTSPAGGADGVARLLAQAPERTETATPAYAFDVVYADWPTTLARTARERGSHVVSGLDMLVHQAAVQFELFTGHSAPIADMKAAGLAAVER